MIANPVSRRQSEEPTQSDNYSTKHSQGETEKVPEKPEANPFDEFDGSAPSSISTSTPAEMAAVRRSVKFPSGPRFEKFFPPLPASPIISPGN